MAPFFIAFLILSTSFKEMIHSWKEMILHSSIRLSYSLFSFAMRMFNIAFLPRHCLIRINYINNIFQPVRYPSYTSLVSLIQSDFALTNGTSFLREARLKMSSKLILKSIVVWASLVNVMCLLCHSFCRGQGRNSGLCLWLMPYKCLICPRWRSHCRYMIDKGWKKKERYIFTFGRDRKKARWGEDKIRR